MSDPFGPEWSRAKLDMPRRRCELQKYVSKYLSELETMDRGLVVDIGCGPADIAPLLTKHGHCYLGIDAPPDESEMGSAYIDACRKLRTDYVPNMGSDVCEVSFRDVLTHPLGNVGCVGKLPENTVCCIHSRGSIEQCLQHAMTGPPHREHHEAQKLNWNFAPPYDASFVDVRRGVITEVYGIAGMWLWKFCDWAERWLRPGGILLVSANGTGHTDTLYDKNIRRHAKDVGLKLVLQEGLLLHKWVKAI